MPNTARQGGEPSWQAPGFFLSIPAVWGVVMGVDFPPASHLHSSVSVEGKVHCVEYKTGTAFPRQEWEPRSML